MGLCAASPTNWREAPGWEGLACLASAEAGPNTAGVQAREASSPLSCWHEHSHQPLLPKPPSGAQTTHSPATQFLTEPGPGQAPPPHSSWGAAHSLHMQVPAGPAHVTREPFTAGRPHQQDTSDTGSSGAGLGFRRTGEAGVERDTRGTSVTR